MYIYTRIYVHLENPFSKTQSMNLALTLEAHFMEWRLLCFGKELVISKLPKPWIAVIHVRLSRCMRWALHKANRQTDAGLRTNERAGGLCEGAAITSRVTARPSTRRSTYSWPSITLALLLSIVYHYSYYFGVQRGSSLQGRSKRTVWNTPPVCLQ